MATSGGNLAWAQLIHLGYNLWSDVVPKFWKNHPTPELLKNRGAADHLRCDDASWRAVTERMRANGLNMAVVDLAEGVRWPSHPELAVKGSWEPEKLVRELGRLRRMGIEPIPKLNFSTSHDTWLGDYARMVSTRPYYKVCEDVIADAVEMFGRPRLFHLGYDEENLANQSQYSFAAVRTGELWWHDFLLISGFAAKRGARPWIWADFFWRHPDEFARRMPKSVLLSNWYYEGDFDLAKSWPTKNRLESFAALDRLGFDQIPAGCNSRAKRNMAGVAEHCRRAVAPVCLKGFLMTTWRKLTPDFDAVNFEAADLLGACRRQS